MPVFHAYDVLAATQLANSLIECDLLISNTKVTDSDGVELIVALRKKTAGPPHRLSREHWTLDP